MISFLCFKMSKDKSEVRFIFYAGAIFVCYFIFGMLQEKITRGKYGDNDKFTCTLSLVLVQCIVNYVFAKILTFLIFRHCCKCHDHGVTGVVRVNEDLDLRAYETVYPLSYSFTAFNTTTIVITLSLISIATHNTHSIGNSKQTKYMLSWKHDKDSTRTVYYFTSAFTYLLGMVSSNLALQWINYPTQVVGKAAKPIPVLILGVLLGRKSYPLKKYLFVFLIVLGVVLFMYKDQAKKVTDESGGMGIGELLLLLSLTMDGLLGAVQERIKAEHSPTAYSMMLNTNWWSSIILTISVLLTGEVLKFASFVKLYPEVLIYLSGLALMGALGQLCIFFMVSEFGPLPCSVVTTTRKFFTVLASVIFFGNVLGGRQWFGAILVFSGLFLDIFYNKSKVQPKKAAEKLIK